MSLQTLRPSKASSQGQRDDNSLRDHPDGYSEPRGLTDRASGRYNHHTGRSHGPSAADVGQPAGRPNSQGTGVPNEFAAVIEKDGDWHIAYCPEIPGANGQGRTKEEAKNSLAEAIELILQDRREQALRGVPEDAVTEVVSLG
jgi:predicted RNase H-like HicB family nuclease